MVDSYVQYVLHSEAKLTANVQEICKPLDSWLAGLSEFLGPASLLDYVIPILGTLQLDLMGDAALMVGLLNVMSSAIKWTFPQHRPYWWIREYDHQSIQLQQSFLSCDTTAGLPSAHSMAFTGLAYILLLRVKLSAWAMYSAVVLLSIPMWTARVYFGSHFLHQCICGSFVAVLVIDTTTEKVRRWSGERAAATAMGQSWHKAIAILAVASVGLFVIGMYFVMLHVGLDPHWSVRMAFKWCTDPQYLRHEVSPIFVMCRDLGFMMGVALSTPLASRFQFRHKPWKVVLAVVVIMNVNLYTRSQTPKNYGRFVFVAYEFVRNAAHSFALLTIVPKFCTNKVKVK